MSFKFSFTVLIIFDMHISSDAQFHSNIVLFLFVFFSFGLQNEQCVFNRQLYTHRLLL